MRFPEPKYGVYLDDVVYKSLLWSYERSSWDSVDSEQ